MNSITPMQSKEIPEKDLEKLHDKNFLFYLVVSKIKGNMTISEIFAELKKDKSVVFDENSLRSTEQAFMDLIQFLYDNNYIILYNAPKHGNHYKVALSCIKKPKQELKEEYLSFIKNLNLEELGDNFATNKEVIDPDAESIQDFFIILNREEPMERVIEHIDSEPLCFFLWLFGIFKNYIEKLFEYHITVNSVPTKAM